MKKLNLMVLAMLAATSLAVSACDKGDKVEATDDMPAVSETAEPATEAPAEATSDASAAASDAADAAVSAATDAVNESAGAASDAAAHAAAPVPAMPEVPAAPAE